MPTHPLAARKLDLITADGICPVFLHTPETGGPWPAVILYMDGPGLRPAIQEMAARLAGHGYAVFLPDLFYRSGPYDPVDPKIVFTDPALRQAHREKYMDLVKPGAVMADAAALLDLIAQRPEAGPGPVGVVGYCMGGRLALIAAGTFPERIAAAASYHGGGLANDAPTSPHLLADRIKGRIYVGGAINDANFDEGQKEKLETALTAAGVDHRIETYPALHGWVPRDTAAHDPVEADHHWQTLVPFLDAALKG